MQKPDVWPVTDASEASLACAVSFVGVWGPQQTLLVRVPDPVSPAAACPPGGCASPHAGSVLAPCRHCSDLSVGSAGISVPTGAALTDDPRELGHGDPALHPGLGQLGGVLLRFRSGSSSPWRGPGCPQQPLPVSWPFCCCFLPLCPLPSKLFAFQFLSRGSLLGKPNQDTAVP